MRGRRPQTYRRLTLVHTPFASHPRPKAEHHGTEHRRIDPALRLRPATAPLAPGAPGRRRRRARRRRADAGRAATRGSSSSSSRAPRTSIAPASASAASGPGDFFGEVGLLGTALAAQRDRRRDVADAPARHGAAPVPRAPLRRTDRGGPHPRRRPPARVARTSTNHSRRSLRVPGPRPRPQRRRHRSRCSARSTRSRPQPALARFQFRARTTGSTARTTARRSRASTAPGRRTPPAPRPFELDAGEPAVLLGSDTGPNPAESLLHALAACLTTSLVYVAAARKVTLTEVESTLEGDMDVRGALGLSDEVPQRLQRIQVTFKVKGDAPPEKLQRGRRARPGALGRLRHGHPRRPGRGRRRHERQSGRHAAAASEDTCLSSPPRPRLAPAWWRSPSRSPSTADARRRARPRRPFPYESIDALKRAGYFAAPIPDEHGGLGATSRARRVVASSRLARGDASVAIGVNMHLSS